jgi:hypothetical protein
MRYFEDAVGPTTAAPAIERRKPARRERRHRARRRPSPLGRALFLLWSVISLLWTGLVAILVFRVWTAPAGSDRLVSGVVIWLALSWLPAMAVYALARALPRLLGRWQRRAADLRERIEAFVGNDPF